MWSASHGTPSAPAVLLIYTGRANHHDCARAASIGGSLPTSHLRLFLGCSVDAGSQSETQSKFTEAPIEALQYLNGG